MKPEDMTTEELAHNFVVDARHTIKEWEELEAELFARLRGYEAAKKMLKKMRCDPTASELAHIIADTVLGAIQSACAGEAGKKQHLGVSRIRNRGCSQAAQDG
jgi:hypothetical protein